MAPDLEEHFTSVIKGAFPEHAEFQARRESGDICVYVDWKLGSDPVRPNKRSKTIRVCISREAISDYLNGSEVACKRADERLRKTVAERLHSFQPRHDAPPHAPAPVEQWTITTQLLNG